MKFYKDGSSIELSKTEQRILYLLVFNVRFKRKEIRNA